VNPLGIEFYNILSAGIAVGILTLPIITSLAEDALRAVPRSLREASYGLGATRFETAAQVVVPAALSGIVAAFLLAIARCVGETMIVALAAGGSVVPLHHVTNPPAQVKVWHEVGSFDNATPIATVAANQSWSTPTVSLRSAEKIDELELHFVPTSELKQVRFELLDAAGNAIQTSTLDVVAPESGKPARLNWEIPLTEQVPSTVAAEARSYGARLAAGDYVARFTPIDAPVELLWANLDGEDQLSLLERAAIPVDVRKSMQPMTGYLVQIFLGDVSNLGVEYYSSYAVAGVLFILTFILTIVGHLIRVRFQQKYE
jgi:hypothetical protein